ncbi:hypothetical protein FRB96_004797 [Tulasnella sp. 330]|nr:hypothetical protein FRB96_004797 [Tulasnella sp. 330]KAG8880279.1 hypothetical protein FRB98_005215 [Tulasnella sp. 332]
MLTSTLCWSQLKLEPVVTEVQGIPEPGDSNKDASSIVASPKQLFQTALHAAKVARRRCKTSNDLSALGDCITQCKAALEHCPIADPRRWYASKTLGTALRKQFKLEGKLVDLEESIGNHREKLSICPIGHKGHESALKHLGQALNPRFKQTGNPADLDDSIVYQEERLSICPIGHSGRSSALNNLGDALYTRFKQNGNYVDLDDSIRYHEEQLSICPIGHSDRPSALTNLGRALHRRFKQTKNSTDLEDSIRYHKEKLSICLTGHSGRSTALNNLGDALYTGFKQTEKHAYLDDGIRYQKGNLAICSIGHSGRPAALTNLGRALLARFKQTKDSDDLNDSIRFQEEKLSICPVGHLGRSSALRNLSEALQARFEQSEDRVDFKESISYFEAAAALSVSSLSDRLEASKAWISLARKYDTSSLTEAYSNSLYLLNRSVLLASSIHGRHVRLTSIGHRARDIAVDAASHAIKTQRLQSAVEILEQGRGLMFNQAGNYLTPLDNLGVVNKELADGFRELNAAMEQSTFSDESEDERLANGEDKIANYQRLSNAWNDTVEEIRQQEGFGSFLRATPFVTLQKSAIAGPIIIVNISQYRSDAIIAQDTGEPLLVPLPDATPLAVRALAKTLLDTTTTRPPEAESDRILRGLLREIWRIITEPIVFQLENTLKLRRGSRIFWVLTSVSSSLPIHASGPYIQGELSRPDRFVSSYVPTISGLLRAQKGYQRHQDPLGPRWLVVAQPEAEGEAKLPHVHQEIDVIRQMGTQNLTDPFQSRFSLLNRDAPLTVLEILKNGLPHAELAVLSACHSAAGDRSAPDESIHLTAGLMFAGFRGVVGTMWGTADVDGPALAEEFYECMFRGPDRVECRDAATALSRAVRQLRRRKVPFDRWITFVHYGI